MRLRIGIGMARMSTLCHKRSSHASYMIYVNALMSRPPVLTSLCCKLVRDQLLILCGNASRRHRFPRLYMITLSHSRTSLDRKRWQLSRVIFTACLPSLIHCSAVPRLDRKSTRLNSSHLGISYAV